MSTPVSIADLIAVHASPGRLDWIGLRPAKRALMEAVNTVSIAKTGLEGDRHSRANARSVTLIQAEHLPVIAALAGLDLVNPETLRRNLVVSGINLTALRNHPLSIGEVVLQISRPCAPCSRMHEALGPGGYNAMRGHGGWCAEVVSGGKVSVGDIVQPA